jgi:peptidase M1-like protein
MRPWPVWILVGLCAGAAPSRARCQTTPVDGTGWTLIRLELDVTIEHPGQLRFSGTARLRLDADSSSGPALSLNTRVPALRYTLLKAREGTSSLNETVPGDSAVRLARIRFDTPQQRGTVLEVEFAYEVERESSQLIRGAGISLASWVENWYPTPLTPDGYTATAAAAPGVTRFHLPPTWRAVSNGRAGARRRAATGSTETWFVERPVARSFAAAPYVLARRSSGRRQIAVYLLSASPASANAQARILDRALGAMERRFGPYPYPSYAIAEIPESVVTWAASSEQGFIMARTQMFAVPGGNLPLFAHEAAHGWWGNAVTTAGPGSKLGSESLAQYGAVVAIEALEGRKAMRDFLRFSRNGYNPLQCAMGYFYIWGRGGDKPLAELEDAEWDHNLSDSKGMWFYDMLRSRLGDEVFFGVLRELIASFGQRSMTVRDIRAGFMSAAPADTALPGFLSQWLDRKGAPVLDVDWWSSPPPATRAAADSGAGVTATIRIRQRQPGKAFVLPLEVLLTLRDSTEVIDTLQLREPDQRFELKLRSRPMDLRVDPFYRLLIWRPEYGPRPPGTD